MQQHNVVELLRRGLCVTLNSDDPAYFGGYMNDNFLALAAAHSLSRDDFARFSFNAIEASFADAARKLELERNLRQFLQTY